MERYEFLNRFIWGAATASYQVEGAIHEDGRTPSIWDTFCERPGVISDGSSGAEACDQYHRYAEDIELMKKLGIDAYRLSIAWPRIFPELGGKVNQKGVDYYLRLLDALRDADIKPVVTMYHWDLPQYLEDRGGWTNRDTAKRYADYAETLAKAFGDRVDIWTTFNEPWCSAYLGYGNGIHAPGIADYGKALDAVHHLNLAHGLGAQAVRGVLGDQANISVTLNLAVNIAQSDSEADIAAKRRADLISNEVFLGPMLEGRYDPEIFEVTAQDSDWSCIQEGDLEIIHQPLHSLGLNYYATTHVQGVQSPKPHATAVWGENPVPAQEIVDVLPPEGELTAMGWNQEPEGLTNTLVELSKRFPDLPLMVTENGSAWDDEVSEGESVSVEGANAESDIETHGKIVHDPKRVAYLNAHVGAVAKALQQGANVIGYFAWSLLDNFEWSFGYTKRFGIIRVDYDTQERIWKDSGLRYREIVRDNAIELDEA